MRLELERQRLQRAQIGEEIQAGRQQVESEEEWHSGSDGEKGEHPLRRPFPRAAFPKPRVGGGAEGLIGEHWRCNQCTVANESILVQCLVCNAARPADAEIRGANGAPVAPAAKFICSVCTYVNVDSGAVRCEMCGMAREAAAGGGGGGGDSKEDDEKKNKNTNSK